MPQQNAEIEKPRYCRREIGDNTPPKFCAKRIALANVFEWCEDCRAERLPFWPK